MSDRYHLLRLPKQLTIGFLVSSAYLCMFADMAAAQSHREQLIAKAKESCKNSRQQLEQTQLPELEQKQTALNVLTGDWQTRMPAPLQNKMPERLQEGLKIERGLLKRLSANAAVLQKALKSCEELVDDEKALSQLNEQAKRAIDELEILEKDVGERWLFKQDFKKTLDKAVDLMIQYNAGSMSTYIKLKVYLDPAMFEQVVSLQQILLLPVQMALKVLG